MTHAPMPGAEGLAEPLRSRWSPSIFDAAHELRDDEVETLLHAAQWAPSRGNTQPWSFLVALRGDPTHAALVPHLSRGNSGWVPRASAVLLACTEAGEPGAYDLGQACAHVVLQAHADGLVAHQFAGFDHDAVAAALGVPDEVRLMAGIAIGVRGDPAEVPERDRERELRVRTRKPLGEIAYAGAWGRAWRS